ncbi:MAG: 30S ribosomal protein S9 [bacterium]|nr:30S ribosomal protein S9 [bacterium]
MAGDVYTAVGRRKSAVARVRLQRGSHGDISINGKELAIYFPTFEMQSFVNAPLDITSTKEIMAVAVKVQGGGIHGQSQAVRHGISRALLEYNPDFRKTLRSEGFLTRDPRVKERKKPGLLRARRAPQFSKR